MKKGIIVAMLALVASVVSFSSCTKQNPSTYLIANYSVGFATFDTEVYDFTVTYTDINTGATVTKAITDDAWAYKATIEASGKPEALVLKVEGKLKPNAEAIIDEMIASGKYITRSHGYSYTCVAGIYDDITASKLKSSIIASTNTFMVDMKPEQFKTVLDKPVVTILDVKK